MPSIRAVLGAERRTFAEMAERTGVPVELLMFVREAAGSIAPQPDDRIRDEELAYVDLIATGRSRPGSGPAAHAADAPHPERQHAADRRDRSR